MSSSGNDAGAESERARCRQHEQEYSLTMIRLEKSSSESAG